MFRAGNVRRSPSVMDDGGCKRRPLRIALAGFPHRRIPRGYLHFTLGGYAHILALMTGIEVFANLVAAYQERQNEE